MKLQTRKYEKQLLSLVAFLFETKFDRSNCQKVAGEILANEGIKDDNDLESLLNVLYRKCEKNILEKICIHLLRTTNWKQVESLVTLVVSCFERKIIGHYDAAFYLSRIGYLERREISSESKNLIEIAEHAIEDENEGFKKVSDDRYFENACTSFKLKNRSSTG